MGALFCLVVNGPKEAVDRNCRSAALLTSVVTFLISLLLWARFDVTKAGFQFEEKLDWIPALNIGYHMGIDGISLFFVLLSTLLTPICILSSWDAVHVRVKEYMIAFLVLETFMVGMFCALDLALFYVFFEGVLIPMFLIIGVWGGQRRVYAAFKFFLYTLLGSVLMLLAIIAIYWQLGTTDIPTAMEKLNLPFIWQCWLLLAFFASFAVKVPMWPVHTWLPDAHVEAPTAGSVILAGVLLKMGGYGFLRLSIPLLPEATQYFAPMIFGLSVVAVIYTSLVALVQEDMKKLIAYSSVAHMGFVTIGAFILNMQSRPGLDVPDAEPRHRLGRALPLRRRGLRPHAHPRDRGLSAAWSIACRATPSSSCSSPWRASACPACRASSASSWSCSAPSRSIPGWRSWRRPA